jgi:hypothetical protein
MANTWESLPQKFGAPETSWELYVKNVFQLNLTFLIQQHPHNSTFHIMKTLTPAQLTHILTLLDEGKSATQISEITGRGLSTMYIQNSLFSSSITFQII